MRWPPVQFLSLAVIGLALIGVSLFIQLSSMDLQAHSISDYLARDSQSANWWLLVPLPLLLGVVYAAAAVIAVRLKVGPKATATIFGGCLVLAIALSFGSGLGIFATVCVAVVAFPSLYMLVMRSRRNEPDAT
jgi:hypothetical protein